MKKSIAVAMKLSIAVAGGVAILAPLASSFDAKSPTHHVTKVRDAARRAVSSATAPLLFASASLPFLVGNAEPAVATSIDIDRTSSVERIIALPTESVESSPQSQSSNDQIVSTSRPTPNPTENYLPRRLYPGTYKNYCGPTPETQVKGGCVAHGWYGDAPADQVDAACQQHDVAYCNCETQLLSRQRGQRQRVDAEGVGGGVGEGDDEDKEIPLLSSMVALRFATKAAVERTAHADAQYFDCINKADKELIATGIRIRGEQQRSGCSTDPNLAWFCDLSNGKGTLTAFERVNLSIFLRDLDADDPPGGAASARSKPLNALRRWRSDASAGGETLEELEARRSADLWNGIRSGRSVADAASAEEVRSDEERILQRLVTNAI